MSLKALSHLVIATQQVSRFASFFQDLFEVVPHYHTKEFCEFVLPDRTRIAFFVPVGKAARYFRSEPQHSIAFGITVSDVEKIYEKASALKERYKLVLSGPPKAHPWGEKSFLLIDFDQNRWEITQSPSSSGKLNNLEEG